MAIDKIGDKGSAEFGVPANSAQPASAGGNAAAGPVAAAGGLNRRAALGLGAGLAVSAGFSQSARAAQWLNDPSARRELLSGVDTIVVLMMENRSFDHFYGDLAHDPAYKARLAVNGGQPNASNTDTAGNAVPAYHLRSKVQSDPPHDWEACHAQWGSGKNDGFVNVHAGPFQQEVMGYFKREDLPFSYWLADQYTVCDQWFASVMGPTWPNRAVLHAATAAGMKTNLPFTDCPKTIWESLSEAGISAKNYFAGSVPLFVGAFLGKVLAGVNPTVPLGDFFADAQAGTLPQFSVIDPDYAVSDDHPSHSVALGQAFIASIYQALAQSPQWSRTLFVLTYDEHGGFYDHVPPPLSADKDPDYRTLGFRVPAVVAGPLAKRGAVCSEVFEHSSIASTLKSRFNIPPLTDRMAKVNDLSACLDPGAAAQLLRGEAAPAPVAPRVQLPSVEEVISLCSLGQSSQSELAAMEASGALPRSALNPASAEERTRSWLAHAQRLGAVEHKA